MATTFYVALDSESWTTFTPAPAHYTLTSADGWSQQKRNLLTSAFQKLGYDKVLKGARALGDQMAGWDDCFLALAYGERCELRNAVLADEMEVDLFIHRVATLLGITADELRAVISGFDLYHEHFSNFVRQWLLQNDPVKVSTTRTNRSTIRSGTSTLEAPSQSGMDAPAHAWTTEKGVGWQDTVPILSHFSSSPPIVLYT